MGNKANVARIGYFRSHYMVAKEALHNLIRSPLGSMFTLAVIAIILALPACLYVVSKNIVIASEQVNQPAAISAYVKEGTPEARIMLLKDKIERDEMVASVEYISSQQGLADLSTVSGFESSMSLLDEDVLPALLVIHPELATKEAQQHILKLANSHSSDITDVRLDKDWLKRFDAVKTLSGVLALSLAVMMLIAVVLIIGNAMRFSVLAHKQEIQVMKFLGATHGYILRPYLYSGMWLGVLGALLAWLVTLVLSLVLGNSVELVAYLYDSSFSFTRLDLDETLILLLLGGFLGLFAAQASARRHLSEIEPT